jgi:hypothetical protein
MRAFPPTGRYQRGMSRIEQDAEDGIVRYLGNLYEVQNREGLCVLLY